MNKTIKNRILRITYTAVMLALLITLQAVTKPMGQLVTGSCVNGVLAVTALMAGLSGGITVAVLSPLMAYLLGIAPQIWTVPAIMVGNCLYVVLLYLLAGNSEKLYRQVVAWLCAAVAKFAAMYAIVVWLICGIFLKGKPMAAKLMATFTWPQLITALIGGGVALLIVPVVRKAVRK